MRRVLIAVPAVAIVVAVAAAAGWWFLIREDAHLATSAPEIPQELIDTSATPVASGSTDGLTFKINSAQSEAAYFVNEELASVGLPSTAKGVTKQVTGTFQLTADGTALAAGAQSQFTVDLRRLMSDKSMRDNRVQQALETGRYPSATFTVHSVSGYDPSIPEGKEQSLQLTGVLGLHGMQKEVTWDVKAFRQANVISALATLKVTFADFNITAPRFGGLVSIDDNATLQVQIIAELV